MKTDNNEELLKNNSKNIGYFLLYLFFGFFGAMIYINYSLLSWK